jgi:hypothetical protein
MVYQELLHAQKSTYRWTIQQVLYILLAPQFNPCPNVIVKTRKKLVVVDREKRQMNLPTPRSLTFMMRGLNMIQIVQSLH